MQTFKDEPDLVLESDASFTKYTQCSGGLQVQTLYKRGGAGVTFLKGATLRLLQSVTDGPVDNWDIVYSAEK